MGILQGVEEVGTVYYDDIGQIKVTFAHMLVQRGVEPHERNNIILNGLCKNNPGRISRKPNLNSEFINHSRGSTRNYCTVRITFTKQQYSSPNIKHMLIGQLHQKFLYAMISKYQMDDASPDKQLFPALLIKIRTIQDQEEIKRILSEMKPIYFTRESKQQNISLSETLRLSEDPNNLISSLDCAG